MSSAEPQAIRIGPAFRDHGKMIENAGPILIVALKSPMASRQIILGALTAALACLVVGRGESASPDWFYRSWQTEDGLPSNNVTGVAPSPDGYLWVATKGGLMRFSGAEFAAVPLRKIPELPSRSVRVMYLDRSGRVWSSMERGPLIGIGESDVKVFFPADGLLPQLVLALTEDARGRLWLAYSGDVCRIEDDRVIRLESPEGIPRGNRTAFLACDQDGQVWLARGDGLGVFNGDRFEPRLSFKGEQVAIASSANRGLWISAGARLLRYHEGREPDEIARLPEGASVRVLFEDRAGTLWIGTRAHGLYQFGEGVLQRVPTSRPAINCITQDLEGYIWAGTNGGGLQLVRPRSMTLIGPRQGLPFSSVQSVSQDAVGILWAVGSDGGLAWQGTGTWVSASSAADWPGDEANCIAADSHGGVWVGMRNTGLIARRDGKWRNLQKSDGFEASAVRSILAASNGDLWLATERPRELQRRRDGKFHPMSVNGPLGTVRAMAEGVDGTIWFGTAEGRILRAEGDELVDEAAITEPFPLSVRTLHVSADGSLWIGYAGDGLGRLKDGRYTRLTTTHGLHDNYISQILDDRRGSLWIAANRGISQVALEELIAVSEGRGKGVRARVFGRHDGLPSLQPSRNYSPAACRTREGRLWFSMNSGLVRAEPDRLHDNALPPPVVLEEVLMDDRTVAQSLTRSLRRVGFPPELTDLGAPDVVLRLPPGHQKLEFGFAALSLASPENIHYRYRLKPFDRNWVEAETRRRAIYPQLPAGRYEFQVLACNSVGVWNETGATLKLVVVPFYWETWWFRIGGGLATVVAASGLVFLGLRRRHQAQLRRIARSRAVEQERTRIARDIHDDLGASLTRITLLSQGSGAVGESAEDELLDQIHGTARNLMRSMEEVVWAVNPEHDTFDALANYVSNYGQGFLGLAGIRCRLDMPMALPERPLSAQLRHNLFLAFKEALNNVVKHADATEVRITLTPGTRDFTLRVEDDGKGLEAGDESLAVRGAPGTGLANMRNRMEEIGGRCEVRSGADAGTVVEFLVPLHFEA